MNIRFFLLRASIGLFMLGAIINHSLADNESIGKITPCNKTQEVCMFERLQYISQRINEFFLSSVSAAELTIQPFSQDKEFTDATIKMETEFKKYTKKNVYPCDGSLKSCMLERLKYLAKYIDDFFVSSKSAALVLQPLSLNKEFTNATIIVEAKFRKYDIRVKAASDATIGYMQALQNRKIALEKADDEFFSPDTIIDEVEKAAKKYKETLGALKKPL